MEKTEDKDKLVEYLTEILSNKNYVFEISLFVGFLMGYIEETAGEEEAQEIIKAARKSVAPWIK